MQPKKVIIQNLKVIWKTYWFMAIAMGIIVLTKVFYVVFKYSGVLTESTDKAYEYVIICMIIVWLSTMLFITILAFIKNFKTD